MSKKNYFKEMFTIGLPITLQSIFQASYNLIDQIMVGQLGKVSIAGSGLSAKYSGLVLCTISSVAAVSSILISQYHGTKDEKGINKSFFYCTYVACILMILFTVPSFIAPNEIMRIYSDDTKTIVAAGQYIRIISISFIPMTLTLLMSSFFRSTERSRYPMYASIISMVCNIVFNYILIFGEFGAPKLGLVGAAIGTLCSRFIEMGFLLTYIILLNIKKEIYLRPVRIKDFSFLKKLSFIMVPIIVNEFLWSLGENVYAVIYGRLGTDSLAAMTLTGPLQAMFIGLFTGVSASSVVMVGKRLGRNDNDDAYSISKFLIRFGVIGSVITGLFLATFIGFYLKLFNVEPEVLKITRYIVYALAIVLFAKVSNMILAGGIMKSGGNTKISLIIDIIGTWGFGVPLGLISAFVFHLPIYWVYFILSQEEVVRLIIGLCVFKRKIWMCNVTTTT